MFDFKVNKHGMNFLDNDNDDPCPFDIYSYIEGLFGKVIDNKAETNCLNADAFDLLCDKSTVKLQLIEDEKINYLDFVEEDELTEEENFFKTIIVKGIYKDKVLTSIFSIKDKNIKCRTIISDCANDNYELVFTDGVECKYYNSNSVLEYSMMNKIAPLSIENDDFINYNIKPDLTICKKAKDLCMYYVSFIKKILKLS